MRTEQVRWVSYLCYLSRAVVALLWGRFLKAYSVISLKQNRTSMILKWRERLVRLIISLDYKLKSLKEVLGSLFLLLVVFLLLSGCLRSVRVSSSAPSSPPQKSSHSPTQTERESTSSSSDSSVSSESRATHYLFWTHQPYGMHGNTALYPWFLLWSKWSKRLTVKNFSSLLIDKFNRQLATTSPSTRCGGQSCEDERCESHW